MNYSAQEYWIVEKDGSVKRVKRSRTAADIDSNPTEQQQQQMLPSTSVASATASTAKRACDVENRVYHTSPFVRQRTTLIRVSFCRR